MDHVLLTKDAATAPGAGHAGATEADQANGSPASLSDAARDARLSGADNADAAERYTWQLAHGHYENFTVVSFLLPKHLRQDFCNIYAFCRTADDLGDESP